MKKIKYRIVYNRKKRLDSQGKALVQVEAYLLGKKAYFSTHIYIKPDQWNSRKSIICNHPHAEELNYMLEEFILNLQMREINAWKQYLKFLLHKYYRISRLTIYYNEKSIFQTIKSV